MVILALVGGSWALLVIGSILAVLSQAGECNSI